MQSQLEDIKQRLDSVEKKAENRAAVGPRGPVGPPGRNGEKGERGEQGIGQPGQNGANGRDGRDGETPSKETLESIVATLLSDYHVLDENGLPHSGPYAKK